MKFCSYTNTVYLLPALFDLDLLIDVEDLTCVYLLTEFIKRVVNIALVIPYVNKTSVV